ncbi:MULTISPECIES: hypothetical protein [Sorangium]|uniref:hypothetical protein n=1 Tax=Sorangium TaxID=39643 RepID=UPI003D9C4305
MQGRFGKVDQACGLVFRYRDENNYYIARANALEGNVRLYHVKDGRRTQIASWSGAVTGNWHELRVDAREAPTAALPSSPSDELRPQKNFSTFR